MTDTAEPVELTPEEGRQMFREICRRELGVEPEEFLTYDEPAAEERWGHERVVQMMILLPFWRGGSDD
jgi:hypothetical protein